MTPSRKPLFGLGLAALAAALRADVARAFAPDVGAASLVAGSVGGAVGVGVSYPLDTLQTKAQVYYGRRRSRRRRDDERRLQSLMAGEGDLMGLVGRILEAEGVTGRETFIGGGICSFGERCPPKCPPFWGVFYVGIGKMQYQT